MYKLEWRSPSQHHQLPTTLLKSSELTKTTSQRTMNHVKRSRSVANIWNAPSVSVRVPADSFDSAINFYESCIIARATVSPKCVIQHSVFGFQVEVRRETSKGSSSDRVAPFCACQHRQVVVFAWMILYQQQRSRMLLGRVVVSKVVAKASKLKTGTMCTGV